MVSQVAFTRARCISALRGRVSIAVLALFISAIVYLPASGAEAAPAASAKTATQGASAVAPLAVEIPASAIPKTTQASLPVPGKNALRGFSKQALVPKDNGQTTGNKSPRAMALSQATVSAPSSVSRTAAAVPAAQDGAQTMVNNERLQVTGSMPNHPEDRFTVQAAPLPGGRQTRSSEEYGNAPEMTMIYKLGHTTSARVALNPQDETSPLYSPIVKENGLAATGVYLDMDVKKDVQVQVGGEVRAYDNESLNSSDDSTGAGASVGFRWNF